MESADGPTPSKKVKLSAAPIDELPDSLLTKIFANLPLKDRHQLCLVSSKWAAASRIPWSDVTFLELSTIPRAMVDSILALCPMLQELCAKDVTINLEMNSKPHISANLHTMKLRSVKFAVHNLSEIKIKQHGGEIPNLALGEYFRRFPKLTELTWQDVTFIDSADGRSAGGAESLFSSSVDQLIQLPAATAASIRRLILTSASEVPTNEKSVDLWLRGLTNLECLYLLDETFHLSAMLYVYDLPNLRELCLSGEHLSISPIVEGLPGDKFPSLEVLVVASEKLLDHEHISRLLRSCSALRILAIAGKDKLLADEHRIHESSGEQITSVILPAPDVDNRSAKQPLQIFVGGDFTNRVRFTLPRKSESANFWRIDCPMPEYVAKPEVAEIFKDVWLAKVIREGPENGLLPWGHPNEMNLFYSTSPLSFY